MDFGSLTEKVNVSAVGSSSYIDTYITKVGQPIMQMYGYKTDGVWTSQQQITDSRLTGTSVVLGGLKIQDISGANGTPDGVVDSYDRTVIGDPYADFTWGITNSFKIGAFDFAFSVQGVQGIDVYNGETVTAEAKRYNRAFTEGQYVSPLNPGSAPFEANGANWILTDYGVEDGSYFKLNDITLGYTVGKDLIKKTGLSKLRLYFSGQNLYYHFANGYRGINPEARDTSSINPLAVGALQYKSYPIPMTLLFGVDINF